MIIKLKIPKKELKSLTEFLELEDKDQEYVINELESINPDNPFSFFEDIVKNTDFSLEKTIDFVKFVENLNINYYEYGNAIDDFFSDVIENSLRVGDIEVELTKRHETLLKRVINLDNNFGIMSKISALMQKKPNLIISTKFLIDLRYIFYDDPTRNPEYALLMHNLVIRYLDKKKEFSNLFFTMDKDTLLELQENIDRELKKEEKLREFCEKSKISVLKEVDWDERLFKK